MLRSALQRPIWPKRPIKLRTNQISEDCENELRMNDRSDDNFCADAVCC